MSTASATRRLTGERLTTLYLSLLFLLLPLVYWDGFFAITEAKAVCYIALSALYLAALLLLRALGRIRGAGRTLTAADGCFLIFVLLSILSSLSNGAAASAFLGADNRYQGILSFLLYGGVYWNVSRRYEPSPWLLRALALSFAAVSALAVLNHWGADPLNTIAPLSAFDRGRYLSTVGNINFLGAYMVLLLPFFTALLLRESLSRRQALWAGLCLLGLWAAMASKSESTVLGLAAALALLPLLLPFDRAVLRRFCLLGPALSAAMQLFSLLSRLLGGDGFSALTRLLLRPLPSLLLFAAGLLGWLGLGRASETAARRVRRGYALGLLLCAALGLLLLLLANTVLPAASLGPLAPYLVISADWGTDRGRIWASCLRLFRAFPFRQKLLGGGAGCLARWDRFHRLFFDAVVDAAHNEYLHYLLTSGLLGLGAYLGHLALSARQALRAADPLARALLVGLTAYAVQALVNIAQPVTTPLFFTLLAVLSARCAAPERLKTPQRRR